VTTQVNIHEAKTHFSKLIEEVERGEEVIIARAGTPVARIVAYEPDPPKRKLGFLKGQIWLAPDFDDPLPWDEWLNDPNDPLYEGQGG
jgi:prevent-host-death family protein